MINEDKPKAGIEQFGYEQALKRVLPMRSVVIYGLTFVVPVAVYTVLGLVSTMTHGMLTAAYFVAMLGMALTAYSYGQMVKAYPIAGSAYSYVQRGLNPYLGFLSGWAILVDYTLLPMLNCMLIGLFINASFASIPIWLIIVVSVIVITTINVLGIQVTAMANNILLVIQFVFVAAFLVIIVQYILGGGGAGTLFDWSAVYNSVQIQTDGVGMSLIFAGASIVCLSFLGFDAVTTIAEEAIEPERNVSRAIMIVCIAMGSLFILVSYLSQLAWPTGWKEFTNPDTAATELIFRVAGDFMGYFFTFAYVVGCIGGAITSQNSAARVLFGMGRDGMLPKFFAKVHPKFKTPINSALIMGLLCLLALVMTLAQGASLVNYGALIGFTLVNVSVFSHYFIREKRRGISAVIKYIIVPLAGACVTAAIFINLDINSKILGTAWLCLGIVYLVIKTKGFKELPPEISKL